MLIKLNLQRFASDYVTWKLNDTIGTPVTYSFKHWHANDTKIGAGTYKFKHWSVVEPLPQLDSPSGLKVTDNILTFGAVENATSYEIFVDNVSIGIHTISSSET